jgi:TolB-like protein
MSFFEELKRRNVIRVGIAYAIAAWIIMQVADLVLENIGAPEWVMQTIMLVLAIGLPLVLIFAWVFEMTPEGLKKERDVDRSQSITRVTGRKLDRVIIGVLTVAVAYLIVDKVVLQDRAARSAGTAGTRAPATQPQAVAEADASPSVAVLPFVNMSDDPGNEYFSDGLTETLLHMLAQLPDLRVAARTSSFAFKGRNEDLREIGDALGVDHVLEGSVRRSGDRLRITAQLIKVADGFHVWSETYDRAMADIFDIQDDVASAISGTLKLRLAPESSRVTDNADAYALYVEALSMLPLEDGDAFRGIRLLDRAIALDTDFAKAFELKALLYWDASGWTISGPETQLIIRDLCARALILDDSLTIARLLRTSSDPDAWGWPQEILAIDDALQSEPENISLITIATYDLISTGYFSEALALAERHVELDPLSTRGWNHLGKAYAALGEHDLARQNWEMSIELGDPYLASIYLVAELLTVGDVDAAIALFEASAQQMGFERDEVRPFVMSALDEDSGLEYLSRWVDARIAKARNYEEQYSPYYWYLYFGYLDEYWRVITAMVEQSNSPWDGTGNMEHMGRVLRSSGFAAHPAYIPYAKRWGVTELWDTRGKPDTCSKDSGEWMCE